MERVGFTKENRGRLDADALVVLAITIAYIVS